MHSFFRAHLARSAPCRPMRFNVVCSRHRSAQEAHSWAQESSGQPLGSRETSVNRPGRADLLKYACLAQLNRLYNYIQFLQETDIHFSGPSLRPFSDSDQGGCIARSDTLQRLECPPSKQQENCLDCSARCCKVKGFFAAACLHVSELRDPEDHRSLVAAA